MKNALVLYPSASTACGIGTWVEALSGSLGERGWAVRVGLAWGRRYHVPSRVEAFRPGLRTLRMDARSGTEEARIQAIARTIERVRPDVVVLTVLDSAFEAVRRLRHAGTSVRLVAVNHGNLPEQAACLQANAHVIDTVVCVSRLSHTAMRSVPGAFPAARLLHVPNAVATAPSAPRRGRGPLVVGYAGRLASEKRAEDIAPFFRELHRLVPEARLWVAGAGDVAPAIAALASEFPAHVRYLGELNAAALRTEFFPRVDVLTHFSAAEAWGYSIAEAMSHGAVPVTSDFLGRSIDGLALDQINALVFPVGDRRRAAEHVQRLAAEPALLSCLSEAAAAHIRQSFSMEAFGRHWARALEGCLSLPPLPQPVRPRSLDARGPLGLRRPWWEPVRRTLGRQVAHGSPGEEWPHFSCRDTALVAAYAAAMERAR
ncbi:MULTISPECIES: glycosyltransferase family 4 protein [Aphanothece]|uniref:glycosyltransferase family 4 protein n=1 Tax=Aphanothece TaxID=1121 RepID=UPI003984A443